MKTKVFHIICTILIVISIVCTVFVFPEVFTRTSECFSDLWLSIKYYFNELFYFTEEVPVTVNDFSIVEFEPILGLPRTWEEFTIKFHQYFEALVSLDNLAMYWGDISTFLYDFSKIFLLIFLPLILVIILVVKRYTTTQNNDYNKDSNALKRYKRFEQIILLPIKNFLLCFLEFLKSNKSYVYALSFIWLFNFNIFTMFVEFLAFYFYFVMSFNFVSIFTQIYKLLCDLSIMVNFVPLVIWLCVICYCIYSFNKKIAYNRLNHYEMRNRGFINERPIVTMTCGSMGKKKTTIISDVALSQEVIFRDKAFEKLLENDMKFPNFPWINLENFIKQLMHHHDIYNLATCRKYMQELASYFYLSQDLDKSSQKSLLKYVKKKYNYKYNNLVFGYDFQKYGLLYDDKLKLVDVWEIIQTYAQLYFIYVMQSSLILSNYSIRTDNVLIDYGNFPIWDTNFFSRDSRQLYLTSKHSHVIDFDALRLGKKLLQDNKFKDSFDFGVINLTEVGKERKNNLELKELKKSEEVTNQKNDGFNDWLKMVRHSATVDNYPFVKVITDEQRPESWGADARDLCEIVHIKESGDDKLALPFFYPIRLLYDICFPRFAKFYYTVRQNRGDNTLLMYLCKKMVTPLYNFYHRTYNTFGYCEMALQVESGTQDGNLSDKKYYLMFKKIYSKRFSTDCFSDFFAEKSLRSMYGINDIPTYQTEKATFEELSKQNSYFITELISKNKGDRI